jgi:hypothetical protein
MASPHVAGAAALYLEAHPSATYADVVAALTCNATVGHVTGAGTASPNSLLHTDLTIPSSPDLPCAPVPGAPTSGIGTIHLSWHVALPEPPVDHFNVYRGTASGAEDPAPLAVVPGNVTSYDDITGSAGTWFYRVTAVDARGESPPSPEISGTSSAPVLTATPKGLSVRLSWTIPPDVGPALTGFDVFMGDTPGGESFLTSVSPDQASFDVQLPGALAEHYFVVKAVKPGPVETPSNEVPATPLPAGPPDAPELIASAGNGRATLTWTAPPANDGTGTILTFRVYRGTSPGAETLLAGAEALPGSQTSYVDTTVTKGATYFYKVSATASLGEGPQSNEQSVTPFSVIDVAALVPGNSVAVRRLTSTTPGPAVPLDGRATSNPTAVSNTNGTFVFVRGGDGALYWQRILNGAPQGWASLGGSITSDPVAVSDGGVISVFARGGDNAIYWKSIVGTSPQPYRGLGGLATSNPAAVVSGNTTFVFVRGGDGALYSQRIVNGVLQGWASLGGLITSDPAAALDGSGVTAFARGGDNSLYRRHLSQSGSPASWLSLGGTITSNPSAVWDGAGVDVVVRGAGNSVLWQRLDSLSTAPGWASLGGATSADAATVTDGTGVWVFVRGTDALLYWQKVLPASSGWQPFGGASASEPAATIVP